MELLQQHLPRLHQALQETLDYIYAFSTYIFGDQAHPGAEDHGRSRENNHPDGVLTSHYGEDSKHYGQEAPGERCEEAGHLILQVPSAAKDPAPQEAKVVLRGSVPSMGTPEAASNQDTPQPHQSWPGAVSLEASSREPTSPGGQAPPPSPSHSQKPSLLTLPPARAGEHEDKEFGESRIGLEAQMNGRKRPEERGPREGREGGHGSGSIWQGDVRRGSPTPGLRSEKEREPEGSSPMEEWELRRGILWLGEQKEEGDLRGSYTQGGGEGGPREQREENSQEGKPWESSPQQGAQGQGEEVDPSGVSAWLGCQREEAQEELGARDRGHSPQADNGEGHKERKGDIWRDSSWPGAQSEGEREGDREKPKCRTQTEEGEGCRWLEGQGEGKASLQLGTSVGKCEEGTREQESGGVSTWLEEGEEVGEVPRGSLPQAEDGEGLQKAEGVHWGGSAWPGVQGECENLGIDKRSGRGNVFIGEGKPREEGGPMNEERELREKGGPVTVEGETIKRMEEQVSGEGNPGEEGESGSGEGELRWDGECWEDEESMRRDGELRQEEGSVRGEGENWRKREPREQETVEGDSREDSLQLQNHGEQEDEVTKGRTWEGESMRGEGEPRGDGRPVRGEGELRWENKCWGEGESMREAGEGEHTGDSPQSQSRGEQEVEEVSRRDISPPGKPMEQGGPGRSSIWLETQPEGEGEREESCPQAGLQGEEGNGKGSIYYGALGESSADQPPLSPAPHSDLPDATQTHLLEPGKVFPLDVSAQRSRVQLRRKGSARRAPSLRVQRLPTGAPHGQPTPETSPQLPQEQGPPAIVLPPMPSQSQMPRRQFPGHAGFGLAHPHMMAELKFRLRKPTPQ